MVLSKRAGFTGPSQAVAGGQFKAETTPPGKRASQLPVRGFGGFFCFCSRSVSERLGRRDWVGDDSIAADRRSDLEHRGRRGLGALGRGRALFPVSDAGTPGVLRAARPTAGTEIAGLRATRSRLSPGPGGQSLQCLVLEDRHSDAAKRPAKGLARRQSRSDQGQYLRRRRPADERLGPARGLCPGRRCDGGDAHPGGWRFDRR